MNWSDCGELEFNLAFPQTIVSQLPLMVYFQAPIPFN